MKGTREMLKPHIHDAFSMHTWFRNGISLRSAEWQKVSFSSVDIKQ